jgi:hypothetical protein
MLWRNGDKFYGRLAGATVELFTPLSVTAMPKHIVNRYYGNPIETGTTTTGLSANNLYGIPFYAPGTAGYTSIGLEITTGAAHSGRLGIYADNGAGLPGALVLDAGTIDCSSTGYKSVGLVLVGRRIQ